MLRIKRVHLAFGVAMMLTLLSMPVLSQGVPELPFSPFLGSYVGQTVFASDSGLTKRDLDVVVTRELDGFALGWTTITRKPSGKVTRKKYIVAFKPTDRPGLYLPVDKVQGIKLDPLKGDPRVWARIKGNTMSVYAVLITDVNGGAKLVHPGGAKLDHLTLCGTRCWGVVPVVHRRGPALLRVALALRGAKQRGRFLWTHRVNHCTGG